MSLSCSCDYDGDGWFYYRPADYSTLKTKRARRCCSCGERIAVGDTVVEFDRARHAQNDIEERIHADNDIVLASWFMCEACGDQYFNLAELGFCINLPANTPKLVREYAQARREYMARGAA
jgi:predicted RNA-binding Zn-ribbon protein involved in translation (DUF1610 family)